MNTPLFIHLRTFSDYSLLEGAIKVDRLIDLAVENNMPALSLTDKTNMFGVLEFSEKAASKGVQPIVGCSINVVPDGQANPDPYKWMFSLLVIVQNEEGYKNLLKLSSDSFLRATQFPYVLASELVENGHGLIVCSGFHKGLIDVCGAYPALLEDMLQYLSSGFADRFYIEIQRHGLSEEHTMEQKSLAVAADLDLPIVATNCVAFEDRSYFKAHDALICIAAGEYLSDRSRVKHYNEEYYFKSAQEMCDLFADLPAAIENTVCIAQRCCFAPKSCAPLIPNMSEDGASERMLRDLAQEGLEHKLDKYVSSGYWDKDIADERKNFYRERLEYELGIIGNMQYCDYFLIVSDFIKWSKRNDIPVGPGRGSGAGSIVAWSIEITAIDPIRYGLIFERFLNPERVSIPDLDIDFCQERRDEVIQYVSSKYGKDRVAHIITFGKLQARGVLRDVGRVLSMPYGQIDKICRSIPNSPQNPLTLSEAIELDANLKNARDSDSEIAQLFDISLRLEGLYRHASTHAAGVVIADRPICLLAPLYYDQSSDLAITQFSMKYAERAGLVKFDFLGLKTLTVISRACNVIRSRGVEIDIDDIPLNDSNTFALLSAGNNIGIFQLENSNIPDILRKLEPDNLEDIIALISLNRPGPMENIPVYIERSKGRQDPDYLHPKLVEILTETYGVIIYQEQVMQIAQVLSGYSLGQADLLRRAMGKKIKEEMDEQRDCFVEGALVNGVDKQDAVRIFDLVAKFAGYGFNKSHAAAYALISYQTAYLKANYCIEFFVALMNTDINDTDKLNILCRDACRNGIQILPPNINKSGSKFIIEGNDIRYALGACKNVGLAMVSEIDRIVQKDGPFKDIFDFVERMERKSVNKKLIESLAKAGTFDCLGVAREVVCGSVDMLTDYCNSYNEEKDSQQANMFGDMGDLSIVRPKLNDSVKSWSADDRLYNEFVALGFYLSEHPLDRHKASLVAMGVTPIEQLTADMKGQTVYIVGTILNYRVRTSRRGSKMLSIVMSDPSSMISFYVYEEAIPDTDILAAGLSIFVEAGINVDDEGGVRITAVGIMALKDIMKNRSCAILIKIDSSMNMADLFKLLGDVSLISGNATILLESVGEDGCIYKFTLPGKYKFAADDINDIKNIGGVLDAQEVAIACEVQA